MTRRIYLLVISISIFANISTSFPAFSDNTDPQLRIGLILPLTGFTASSGAAAKTGALMAYDQLEESTKKKVKLFFEDDRMSTTEALTAFSRLQSLNNINAAISLFSGQARALAPIAENSKTPLITIANAKGISEDRKYIFSLMPVPELYAKITTNFLAKNGVKNIALFSLTQDAMQSIAIEFKKQIKGKVNILVEEEFDPQVTDYKTSITKLKARKDIDMIVTVFWSGPIGLFTKQLHNLGVTIPQINSASAEDPEAIRLGQDAIIGLHYVCYGPKDTQFTEKFKTLYPEGTVDFGVYAFDAVNILVNRWLDENSAEKIPDRIHAVKKFSGAAGNYEVDNNNHFLVPASLKIITPEGPKFLE